MLIMSLLLHSIGSVQYVMNLLADVMNALDEVVCFVSFRLDMSQIILSSCKWHGYVNGTQWLESQAHLKGAMAGWAMESSVITMLYIGEALVPCAWMLWIVHVQNVYNHSVDDLCLAIYLVMESCGLGELGVQHWPEAGPKCFEEPSIPIWYDRLWDPKVHPHSFKEEFSSGLCCDILLASRHNGHLRESIDDHENTVISMLIRRQARHVIHGDGFPRSTRGM